MINGDMEDEECWVQLEDYRLLLIKTIEPSRITPYLRQCKVLSCEDEEQIFNDPNLVIRRRKVGMLLDILQRTGHKGYIAFLESLELDYPQLYRKITGKEPARAFSILVDVAGDSGLTQFLMNEVTQLQKSLQGERLRRQEMAAQIAAQEDITRQQQVRERELRKQQERVRRMQQERNHLAEEVRRLKDENYGLLRDVTRLSEEKNSAVMSNRDLHLEIEKLKHSLMNAESDFKIQRKCTVTLKNAMEQRPSQDMIWQMQRQNDLLKARVQELETSIQQAQTGQDKLNIQSLDECKQQAQAKQQQLLNNIYILRRALRNAEELRDKNLVKKEVLEVRCTTLEKDSKMYRDRMKDILKQMDEVILERDKAISTREEYHLENSRNLQEKDQYRKQIRELGERCDELQIQLFRTQGEVISLEMELNRTRHHCSFSVTSDIEDVSLQSWQEWEQKSQTSEEEYRCRPNKGVSEEPGSLTSGEYSECVPLQDNSQTAGESREDNVEKESFLQEEGLLRPRERCNFYYRRKRALRTKTTSNENPHGDRDNTTESDNTDTDGM